MEVLRQGRMIVEPEVSQIGTVQVEQGRSCGRTSLKEMGLDALDINGTFDALTRRNVRCFRCRHKKSFLETHLPSDGGRKERRSLSCVPLFVFVSFVLNSKRYMEILYHRDVLKMFWGPTGIFLYGTFSEHFYDIGCNSISQLSQDIFHWTLANSGEAES